MPALLIPPGEARSVSLGGLGVVFKISSEETGGRFSVVEHRIDPGGIVHPHRRTKEDEFSCVLEDEVGLRIGRQEFQAGAGSYVFKPRGVPHGFWNPGPKPTGLIEFMAPAGVEKYLEKVDRLIRSGATPGGKEPLELNSRFGQTTDGMEWIPELLSKYHVRLAGR